MLRFKHILRIFTRLLVGVQKKFYPFLLGVILVASLWLIAILYLSFRQPEAVSIVFIVVSLTIISVGYLLSIFLRQMMIKGNVIQYALFLLILITGFFIGINFFVSGVVEFRGVKFVFSVVENDALSLKVLAMLLLNILILSILYSAQMVYSKKKEKEK